MKNECSVAVIIRGKARTWDWTKSYIFSTLESVYKNIDWYVAFWKSNTIVLKNLHNDFKDKNLKCCRLVDENCYPFDKNIQNRMSANISRADTYWRLSYLDYLIGYEKTKSEILENKIYDLVIFIRPDAMYVLTSNDYDTVLIDMKMSPFMISNNMYELCKEQNDNRFAMADDFFYYSDSITSDIITSRFFDTFYTDYELQVSEVIPESAMTSYLQRHGITSEYNKPRTIEYHVIRPDVCRNDYSVSFEFRGCWDNATYEEKNIYCSRLGIDPKDYNL